jgi:hypothetical protein
VTDCIELFIQAKPIVDAGPEGDVCEDGTFCLTGATAEYTNSLEWSTAGDGGFDFTDILNPCYTPGTSDIAAEVVELTLTGQPIDPCTLAVVDVMTLNIQILPVVDAGVDGTTCDNTGFTTNPTITTVYDYTVEWTHNGNGAFDDPTMDNATYNPVVADGGNIVTLTLTVTPGEACATPVVDQLELYIQASPIANAGADATICEYICIPPFDNGEYPLADATVENACGQFWISLGDGSFDDASALNPIYSLGANDIINGFVQLELTAEPCDPCAVSHTDAITITVERFPEVAAGVDQSICGNEVAQLDGTSLNVSSVYWDFASVGVGNGTFSDQTIDDPTYTPSAEDIIRGYVSLVFIGFPNDPCTFPVSDVVKITIYQHPEAYAGPDASICEDGSYQLTGAIADHYASTLWSGGAGTFSPSADVLNPTYTPAPGETGTVSLCLTAQPIDPCTAVSEDCMVLSIQALPIVDAGVDATITHDQTHNVAATVTGTYTSVEWSTSGDGTFDDPASTNTVYNPGPADEGQVVTLTITVTPDGVCTTPVADFLLLTIDPSPIVANDDDGVPVNGYEGGVSVPDVLVNDVLNGAPVVLAEVILTEVSSTDPNVYLDPLTGEVIVLPGTPEGTYYLVYQICEIIFPMNCDQATVTVPVTAAPIVANDDNGGPTNGYDGGVAVDNVLDNDLLNGNPVDPTEVTLTQISTTDPDVYLDETTGEVIVDPGTPEGTYTIVYEICEILNPTNCDQATVTVEVVAAPIVANDDAGTPVNGYVGGVSYANVLDNDLLNGDPVIAAEITLVEISSTDPNVYLDPTTGEVIVLAGTPEGTYYLVYEICEILNPTNCDQATVTVPVTYATIVANDDTGTPVNGYDGGTSVTNVLDNDELNGNPIISTEVTLVEISSTNPNVTLNPVTGEVDVAAGTPEGTYYLVYEICEILNPTNCDQATVTVEVTAAPIVANDDAGTPVNGYDGGVSYNNVLDNDLLNGDPVIPAEITLQEISSTHPNVSLNPVTGEVIVAAGTPEGTYYLVYEICEILNPTNCDQATVTVPVTAAPIIANDDTGTPVNGYDGGVSYNNVLDNDLLNGDPINPAEITLVEISSTDPNVHLDPNTGEVIVDPGTPAGTYYLVYEICEILNPGNCDQATVMVEVTAAPIVANDDTGAEVNGTLGGVSVADVLVNDLLNGDPVNPAEVILTEISSTHPGVSLNLLTGEVIVAPGTPEGNYELVYQICEVLNPGNCDQATVTVPVWEEPTGQFCFNGDAGGFGAEFTYCSTEIVTISLCDIFTGIAPFDICWELAGVPDCKTGVNNGDALFSGTLPPGVYSFVITSITDAIGHTATDVSMYNTTINIVTGPVVFAGNDASICLGEDYELLDASAEQYSSLEWTGGTGTFMPNANVLNPTYVPAPGESGIIELCLSANPADPCTFVNNDCMLLTIQLPPVANAGADAEVCEDALFVDISGTATNASEVNWSGGTGFFDDPSAESTTYFFTSDDIDAGTVELCLTAEAVDPCTVSDTDCLILTITPNPEAYAGANNTICEGETYELSDAWATSYAGISWSTMGDGNFDFTDIENPVYTPGTNDISNGSAQLCLTADPLNGCTVVDMDCMTLTISAAPTVELGSDYNLDCDEYDIQAGEWLPLNMNVTIGGDYGNIMWTTDGDGYFDDPTALNAVYNFGLADIWKGDIELCIEVQGAGSCQFTASDCVMVYVPQQLIYYDHDGWWGLSSYLDPDLTTVPEVMDPLVLIPGSQHLVTMVNRQGKYFWPEPVPPTNTIGNWSSVGYKIKTKNTPACLPIFGDTLIDQTFAVSGAFTFLPVLTNVPVNISDLFGANLGEVLLIYDWASGDIWTAVASDFDELLPGRAYLLVNVNPGNSYTVEFPDFDPLAPHLYPTTKGFVSNNSPWNDVENTAQPHAILFGDEALAELQPGDIIGTFDSKNVCFGMTEYEGPGSFYKIVAMGNNIYSKDKDGFENGEVMRFVLYRQNTHEAFELNFQYDESYPNYDDKFAVNGVSMVTGMTMTVTSIEEMIGGIAVSLYPNPSRDIVNIESNHRITEITLINNVGQRMVTREMNDNSCQIDISDFAKGMYVVEIRTNEGDVVMKRLIVE